MILYLQNAELENSNATSTGVFQYSKDVMVQPNAQMVPMNTTAEKVPTINYHLQNE